YNRLNQDYERLHWLCHFILAGSGPTHVTGTSTLQPLLINMYDLFEQFVAEWLRRGCGKGVIVESQKTLRLHAQISFRPDVVLRDRWGRALVVVDTKYKIDSAVAEEDVAQIIAYAESLGCRDAVLVYPYRSHPGVIATIGSVTVRTLGF